MIQSELGAAIKFGRVSEAVIWAEATLLRTGLGSQMGKIIKRSGYQEENPNPTSLISAEDTRDIAHTISCKVSHIDPHISGALYRFICGGADMHMAHQVSREMSINIKARANAKKTPTSKFELLALAVMIAERKRKQFGLRTSGARMARSIGISPQAFAKQPWSIARISACEIVDQWVEMAERQLSESLKAAGVL